METSFKSQGKIAHGLRGAGTVTRDMVEHRARELAVIEGRDSVNADDLRNARAEMLGAEIAPENEQAPELMGSSKIADNPANSGHRVPTVVADDEQAEVERMVQGGVDEAEHDTMVRGARSPENQE